MKKFTFPKPNMNKVLYAQEQKRNKIKEICSRGFQNTIYFLAILS